MSPLICFEIVEWHRPEQVLYRFGLHQEIPPACSYKQQLHKVDARGRHQRDMATYHAPYIASRIKISVNTDISVIGFYGNIGNIGNIGKISVDIFTKISVIKFFLYFNYIDYEK